MTAQVQDTVKFEGKTYLLANSRGELPFKPERYGLEVTGTSSISWRGYTCAYRIESQTLLLEMLEASVGRYEGAKFVELEMPRINNTQGKPQVGSDQVFNTKYEHLHLQLPYSGTLILADDYDEELLGQPTGMEAEWMFKKVLEVTFNDGILQEVKDVSDEMASIRSERI